MGKANKDDLIRLIQALDLSPEIDPEALKEDIPLNEQGLDSLDTMNLYFQIEEQFKLKITDESLENREWNTINKILSKINESR